MGQKWRRYRRALFIAMLLASTAATAGGADSFRPENGITQLDLIGDGTPAMVVVGKRENFNAHTFDVVSLFVRVNDELEVVPVFDGQNEHDNLTSSGGADCRLHDFRLIRRRSQEPLALAVADRDYGDSFVDARPVTFRLYELARNASSAPGSPTWSFQLRSTRISAKSYCDVGNAFADESAWRE